jgi:hypothetical protein
MSEGIKNGIGITNPITPVLKVAGASPGYDPFTKSIAKGRAMSAGPIEIEKKVFVGGSKSGKITMKSRPGRG